VVADIAPIAYRHHNTAIAASLRALALTPGMSRAQADSALAESVADPAVRGFLLQNLSLGPAPGWRIGLDEIAAGMADIEGFPVLPAGTRYLGPALFFRGSRSDYVGEEARTAIPRLFPAARIETIAAAGHWLHADQPAAFGARVEGFLLEAATVAQISL
jgi:pimeloyl-ACP methyl ester carboxylesterase